MKTTMETNVSRIASLVALAGLTMACSSTPNQIWNGTDCEDHAARTVASVDERVFQSAVEECEAEREIRQRERLLRRLDRL